MTNEVTLKELSEKLILTPRRAQQLVQAGIFVRSERGKYLLAESAVGYALFLRKHSEAVLPVSIGEISRCIGEELGNTRQLGQKGMFKKLSHGKYDLIESIRNYIHFQKTAWRDRRRQLRCSCGAPMLPLMSSTREEIT